MGKTNVSLSFGSFDKLRTVHTLLCIIYVVHNLSSNTHFSRTGIVVILP